MLKTALKFSHQLLSECVTTGDIVIDATMGNGHDTLFLSHLVGEEGHVFAFDIQEQALIETQKKLNAHAITSNVTLIHDGHEKIERHLPLDTPIKAAVFNLGYLPRGDKQITTQTKTTLEALMILINRVEPRGRIILVLYSGHDEGKTEKQDVLEFAQHLPQEEFSVMTYQFINQKNCPPSILCIEKKENR